MKELRFDAYSVERIDGEYRVVQLLKDVPMFIAQIFADVDEAEFVETMTIEGWLGTCPEWITYMPIVTLPQKELLGVDELDFMLKSVAPVL